MASSSSGTEKTDGHSMQSMTGFSALTKRFETWSFSMDLRAVNGRGLDIRLRMPDWIEGLEAEARKHIQSCVARGSVTLSTRVSRDETVGQARVNETALTAALTAIGEIERRAQAAGVTLAVTDAAAVASMRGVIETSDETTDDTKPLKAAILSALGQLTDDFNADRSREGAALARILTDQIDEVARLRKAATLELGDRTEAQKATLRRNLSKLLESGDMPDEARLAQELALIAVKTDISEELDRLGAHIDAARALLGQSGPVGRKLDFLMQEFNREANTLCSKAQSTTLTQIGLEMKTVIDQMREQVQNVE